MLFAKNLVRTHWPTGSILNPGPSGAQVVNSRPAATHSACDGGSTSGQPAREYLLVGAAPRVGAAAVEERQKRGGAERITRPICKVGMCFTRYILCNVLITSYQRGAAEAG